MKKLIVMLILGSVSFAFGKSVEVPVEFEVIKADVSCNQHSCYTDEETGEERCRYSVYFDERSYEGIKILKQEKGYTKTWFEKSPYEMCTSGMLPMKGEGFSMVNVILYKVDLSALNAEL